MIGAVYVALPKFIPHQIDFDHVVIHDRDVTVDHIVPKDVTVDHVVPRDVTVDHIVPHDVTVDHYVPLDPKAALGAPVTPTPKAPLSENDFEKTPDWQKAGFRKAYICRRQRLNTGSMSTKTVKSSPGAVSSRLSQ